MKVFINLFLEILLGGYFMDNNHSETYDINEILNLHRINDEKRDKRSEIDSKVMNFCLIAITISVCAVIWFYIILAMVKIISG